MEVLFYIAVFLILSVFIAFILKSVYMCGLSEGVKIGIELCLQEVEKAEVLSQNTSDENNNSEQ